MRSPVATSIKLSPSTAKYFTSLSNGVRLQVPAKDANNSIVDDSDRFEGVGLAVGEAVTVGGSDAVRVEVGVYVNDGVYVLGGVRVGAVVEVLVGVDVGVYEVAVNVRS